MKTCSKSIINIFTLVALLVSLLGSAVFALPVQTVAAANTSSLSAGDWAQIKALLPTSATTIPDIQHYLKASNTGANDFFGWSMSLSGDTLAVGAYQEGSNSTGVNGNQIDDSAFGSGAVYIFIQSGGVWSQQAYLKASNTELFDNFGYAVSLSGNTLVVGAPSEDSNATGVNGNQGDNSAVASGAAYVFTRSGATWSQQAYLKASNTNMNDSFGSAVSISDDTILVGAWEEDSNATDVNGNQLNNSSDSSGAAYIFTRTGTIWSQQAYLKASNTNVADWFGSAVSISGDTVVVGAYGENSNATGVNGNQADASVSSAGAAYVYTRSGTTWSQQAYLKASNTGEDDEHFGHAVSISGDTIVIGARAEDSNATGVNGDQANNSAGNSGAAYVFTRTGTTWSQQAYLKASHTGTDDLFGSAVSISGDMLVIGAYQEDSNATGVNGNQIDDSVGNSGAAYVFTRTGTIWSQQAYLKASNTEAGDWFGSAVSVSAGTFAVGALHEDSNATGVNGNETNNSVQDPGATYMYSAPTIFTDVPYTYWANSYIEHLYNAGITGGCGTGVYCPDNSVTRAQMAIFILKGMHGSSFTPPAVDGSTGFTDVAADYWAGAWIKQLAAEGITGGCGTGVYCPDATVTRAQMAVFLLKAKHGSSYSPLAATGVFTDVPTSYWAASWIEQLATEGVTSGCGAGTYCPDNSVTRAQMAVFLVKAFNLP